MHGFATVAVSGILRMSKGQIPWEPVNSSHGQLVTP